MTPLPEFSRPERIDTIGHGEREIVVTATAAECAALARRFGLIGIDRLTGTFRVRRDGDAVLAVGRVASAVTQSCIATGEPVAASVDEDVSLRFVPDSALNAMADDEIELGEQDCDTIAYGGGAIDLGEATAESMALALPAYPRSPHAEAVLREAGVKTEGEAGPFGALASLRDKLGKA